MLSKALLRVTRSISGSDIPAVDMTRYLQKRPGWEEDCKTCAKNLRDYGVIYIKDPRADYSYNWKMIDLMEKYFAKRSRQMAEGMDGPQIDIIEHKHQLGLKKPYYEKVDDYLDIKQGLSPQNMCKTPLYSNRDTTISFAWDINLEVNPKPKDFPELTQIFQTWGSFQQNCCLTTAEMIAVGLGLPTLAFRETIEKGECLVHPPAVNLDQLKVGDMMISFHHDFTLLTVHGKNRFPGLYFWTVNGERFQPKVPEDHFLIHSGKQLQWITGGYFKPAFHEIYYGEDTEAARQQAEREGRSRWRVSTPCFAHIEGHRIMTPMEPFRTPEAVEKYPPITSDDYYRAELDLYDRQ